MRLQQKFVLKSFIVKLPSVYNEHATPEKKSLDLCIVSCDVTWIPFPIGIVKKVILPALVEDDLNPVTDLKILPKLRNTLFIGFTCKL